MVALRLIALILAFCPGVATADRLVVFAAASLAPALEQVVARWEGEAVISAAGSSVLARQIARGAPADVFVSANSAWMDDVAAWIVPDTRVSIASNTLVVVGPVSAPGAKVADALAQGRVAMGLVEAAPVGIYARQALETMGLWATVAPRVVQADNARAALALVAMGEVPRAVVYATDALAEPRVAVVAAISPETHGPILYPAAALTDSPAARGFVAFLAGPEGQAILRAHGFAAP